MAGRVKIKDIEENIKEMEINDALNHLYDLKLETGLSLDKLISKYTKKKDLLDLEHARFNEMCKFEREAYSKGATFIAGVDEAGRGPLAGPVVAAAVILPENIFIPKLNDSKKLSSKQRDELYSIIMEKAIAYGVGMSDEKCIDEINILNATKKAMEEAVLDLKPVPDFLLTDAVGLQNLKIPQWNIIGGDALSTSIAAASIIAKVTRDRIIEELDTVYPQYGFAKHKGYGTKEHIDAIKKFGICPIHRMSFVKNFTGYKQIMMDL